VISADVGLALPDFRACERTFSMLTQVAGRAGRGLLGGQAIFQTYQPDHYAIRAAAQHDYAAFYAREIEARRELGYPPFRRMARVLIQHQNPTTAAREAGRIAELMQEAITAHSLTGTTLIGPAPCFFGRINRAYRWQIILRGPDPLPALRELDLGRFAQIDPDPLDVL
jgi:primosomal protein N' (replication factor Y)